MSSVYASPGIIPVSINSCHVSIQSHQNEVYVYVYLYVYVYVYVYVNVYVWSLISSLVHVQCTCCHDVKHGCVDFSNVYNV